jgi:dTDP-glucose 4,6-dehydratase
VNRILSRGVDAVVNFAAESHVDRSILDASEFVRSNILGTLNLLDCARRNRTARFIQISTDEVYGSLGPSGSFTESSPLAPNSPYAASKASADLMVRSYSHTYGFPAIITRCSNNYGPYQFPEKLIPLLVTNALSDMPLPIYGDGLYVRDWIHVRDHCSAVDHIVHDGRPGETYNIGARQEMPNLEIARLILRTLGKREDLLAFVKDRPGHDRRYSIDPSKIELELGWRPAISFSQGLAATVEWYRKNPSWVEHVRSGEYATYYDRMYRQRQHTLSGL